MCLSGWIWGEYVDNTEPLLTSLSWRVLTFEEPRGYGAASHQMSEAWLVWAWKANIYSRWWGGGKGGGGGYSLHIVWLTAITSMPWPASPDQEQLPSWGSPIMCRVWSKCRRKKWVQIAPLTGALAPGWAKEITVHLAPVQCGCLLRLPRAIRSCEFDTKKKTRLAIEEIPGTSETHALADLQWAV